MEEGARRWAGGVLRRSGARARRVLHARYRSLAAPVAAPDDLDIDDTVSCFCRCAPSLTLYRACLFSDLP